MLAAKMDCPQKMEEKDQTQEKTVLVAEKGEIIKVFFESLPLSYCVFLKYLYVIYRKVGSISWPPKITAFSF